jgi:hypothetical protein
MDSSSTRKLLTDATGNVSVPGSSREGISNSAIFYGPRIMHFSDIIPFKGQQKPLTGKLMMKTAPALASFALLAVTLSHPALSFLGWRQLKYTPVTSGRIHMLGSDDGGGRRFHTLRVYNRESRRESDRAGHLHFLLGGGRFLEGRMTTADPRRAPLIRAFASWHADGRDFGMPSIVVCLINVP